MAKENKKEKTKESTSDFLDGFINNLEKSESFNKFSSVDLFRDTSAWLPSGSPLLDFKLNTLGYPVGIIEIRGKSQSGKTTLSLHGLLNFQKRYPNGIAVILSTERRDNKVYAQQIGVDTDRVIIAKCRSIEDVFNKVQSIITKGAEAWTKAGYEGKPKFYFIWDSLGATISNQERKMMEEAAKEENEDHHKAAMASAARALKRGMRYLTGEIYDYDIWFMIINHVYSGMAAFSENKSYGGTAIEFHPNLRLNLAKTGYIKIRDKKIGQNTILSVIKSDFNSDMGEIPLELYLGKGFILNDSELELAVEEGILERNGKNGFSFMNGKLTWNNKPELYDLYGSDNKLLKILENKINKAAHKRVLEYRGVNPKEDVTESEE